MNSQFNNNRNNRDNQSVFKNIVIICGCIVAASIYVGGAMLFMSSFGKTDRRVVLSEENESKPAWIEDLEIEIGKNIEDSTENNMAPEIRMEIEAEIETMPEMEAEYSNNMEQEPRFENNNGRQSDRENPSNIMKQINGSNIKVRKVQTVRQSDTAKAVVTDVSAVVEAAMPCVVSITNEYTAYDYWYDEMVDGEASASGIIVAQNDEELMIMTNYHVVEDNNNLYVQFIDGSEAEAYVKGSAPEEDLAVITVFLEDIGDDTLNEIAIAAFGDSDGLLVGEPAIAIGNSLGYGQSVTTGVISALNRYVYDENEENVTSGYLIQTDAAINPGNSGGALLNVAGEVIGINSSKIANYVTEGMGYAIPINTAEPIIDELMMKETRRKVPEDERAFLGIAGSDVSEEAVEDYGMPEGIYVSRILDGTAAEKAGIKKGDIIISMDGETLTMMTKLQDRLEYYTAGTKVEIIVMRMNDGNYEEYTFDVVLGSKKG